jgi:hypothetical protein
VEAKKHRQHHVWQHYLRSWTVGGRIFCLGDGRIFATGTSAIAVETDFYKLHKLTAADIVLIRTLVIEQAHPIAKRNHEEFLQKLMMPLRFVEHNRTKLSNIDQIDDYIDTFQTNVLEDYHAHIEAAFIPLLDRALCGDIGFYDNTDTCISFLHFLSTQYLRTKGIKNRSIEIVERENGIDMRRIWDVISPMFSLNTGCSLFLERRERKLVLVRNSTDTLFITGDQPVINLHGGGSPPVTKFTLYYPLSPTLALFLCEAGETAPYATDSLTSEDISALNVRMLTACHRHVFGQTEASLLALLARSCE